jgi:hypothetical protein
VKGKPDKVKPEREVESGVVPSLADSGGGGGSGKAEDQLPVNSAGSAASRHGGSVYDIIVQVCSHTKGLQDCSEIRYFPGAGCLEYFVLTGEARVSLRACGVSGVSRNSRTWRWTQLC